MLNGENAQYSNFIGRQRNATAEEARLHGLEEKYKTLIAKKKEMTIDLVSQLSQVQSDAVRLHLYVI